MSAIPVGPNMLRGPKRCLTTTGVNFRPIPSMQCPPMILLSQSEIYMVRNTRSRKTDQSAKLSNGTVNGQCMSLPISWANKMEWAQCDNLVGFPKSSHTHTHTNTCTDACTHTRTHVRTHTYTHIYKHTYIQTCIHTYIYMVATSFMLSVWGNSSQLKLLLGSNYIDTQCSQPRSVTTYMHTKTLIFVNKASCTSKHYYLTIF